LAAPAALDLTALLLGIVAERTGYPTDMLGLDADLEADLGIDSIKRVEILGALRKALPAVTAEAMQAGMERFTKAKSLAAWLALLDTLPGAAITTAPQVQREVATPAPVAVAAFDAPALLLGIVAERTGYPTDMLGLDADLEADLGIDSIKRVEILGALRKTLPAPIAEAMQAGMERFTKAKSLAAILKALDALGLSAPAPVAAPVTAPVAAPVAAQTAASAPALDPTALLLGIVAERTGYPTDMLGLDADLEADLGIDSIKRVEILGALRKALPAATAEAMQADMERFTKAKSLAAILQALAALAPAPIAASAPARVEPAPSAAASVAAAKPLARYVIQPQPRPLAAARRNLSGTALLLAEPGTLTTAVSQALKAKGLASVIVGATARDAMATAVAAARTAHGPITAVLSLHGLRTQRPADLAGWRADYQRDVLALFHALQALGPDLAQASVVSASRLGGLFGRDGLGDGVVTAGGANGMFNCLRDEYPAARFRAVDFDAQSEAEVAEHLVAELLADDLAPEAGWRGMTRYGSVTAAQALLARPEAATLLPAADWVVLATGGARGITAGILETMALPGMRLVLLGRSALPGAEAPQYAAQTDAAALRKALLAERLARGEKPKPVDIDRELSRLMTDREIRANLARLAAKGAVVDYRPCDVRDEQAFAALIDSLYAEFGTIDAVLHAAGVIEDKLFADKTPESFERVLGTKLDAAFVLSQKLKPDSLKALSFFTSVAGRYGNRGQSDYAAANETLNRLAWRLAREWPGVRVSAINWGPWDAGMASEGVKAALRERGMEPIPLAAGARFFLDELAYGAPGHVEVVAGIGPWGFDAITLPDHDPVVSRPSRITASPTVGAGGAVLGEALFDPVADGLDPRTLATELLAEFAAMAWPEWRLSELKDLRMEAAAPGVGVADEALVQLRARAASHSEPGSQSATMELLSASGKRTLARATAVLVPEVTKPRSKAA
jgi:acyl carrier protein/NADP-dependent 3-hydroxy acid dehydrogenase YdfG